MPADQCLAGIVADSMAPTIKIVTHQDIGASAADIDWYNYDAAPKDTVLFKSRANKYDGWFYHPNDAPFAQWKWSMSTGLTLKKGDSESSLTEFAVCKNTSNWSRNRECLYQLIGDSSVSFKGTGKTVGGISYGFIENADGVVVAKATSSNNDSTWEIQVAGNVDPIAMCIIFSSLANKGGSGGSGANPVGGLVGAGVI